MVVEAKDQKSSKGRKQITDALTRAMPEREANAAIYLSHVRDGLAKEIDEWAEGQCERGPFVTTTHEHLATALRFLIVQQRLAALRASNPEIDLSVVEAQIGRIRTSLGRITNINGKVSSIISDVNDIRTEVETLRNEVQSALSTMEEAFRTFSNESQMVGSSLNGKENT